MLCSAIHAIIIDIFLRFKHAPKVRRTWRSSLASLSKIPPPSVNSKSHHGYKHGNERIREWQQSRNDKGYCKVDANPHRCFNDKSFFTIVHLYKPSCTIERPTNKISQLSSHPCRPYLWTSAGFVCLKSNWLWYCWFANWWILIITYKRYKGGILGLSNTLAFNRHN